MPLSAFYDMGERLTTSMFTGQTQDTGLFDGLKELTLSQVMKATLQTL